MRIFKYSSGNGYVCSAPEEQWKKSSLMVVFASTLSCRFAPHRLLVSRLSELLLSYTDYACISVYCEIGFSERILGDHIFCLVSIQPLPKACPMLTLALRMQSREGNASFGSDVFA